MSDELNRAAPVAQLDADLPSPGLRIAHAELSEKLGREAAENLSLRMENRQYVERIRHLEREAGLLSMVADQLKARCASADALIEDMATKADHSAYIDGRTAPPAASVASWGAVETVGDMVRNLLTLDQSLPIHAAFHVDIEGARRCRTRPLTISRERVIEGKWVDPSRKDVPYAVIVWAKQDERTDGCTAGTASDDTKHIESEAVSAMLWLYRRLHHCYGRPPNIEQPITALAKLAGFEMKFIAESFAERAAAPSTQEGAK